MGDFSTAGRALLAVTGSALLLGSGAPLALADDFDGRHLSVNQGAACALRDLGETGGHVARTGALPEVFHHVETTSGQPDGIKTMCHAVEAAPSAGQPAQGLLGGLPVGG